MGSGIRHPIFWVSATVVVILDVVTKRIALATLADAPVPVLGDWFMFRLVFNPGAAFGLHVGDYSRWVFLVLALVALVVLGSMARHTPPERWIRLTALALVCGGAVGNLIDRIRWGRGVVDFIDVWIGSYHWPTFNVADMAVSCGALTLALVLWLEGRGADDAAQQGIQPNTDAEADPAGS